MSLERKRRTVKNYNNKHLRAAKHLVHSKVGPNIK